MRQFRFKPPPTGVHPCVRRLFEEMAHQHLGVKDMAERSGVAERTIRAWRTRSPPAVPNLDACFGVLGYELRAIPKGSGRSIRPPVDTPPPSTDSDGSG